MKHLIAAFLLSACAWAQQNVVVTAPVRVKPSAGGLKYVYESYRQAGSDLDTIDVEVTIASTDTPEQVRTKLKDAVIAGWSARSVTVAAADIVLPATDRGSTVPLNASAGCPSTDKVRAFTSTGAAICAADSGAVVIASGTATFATTNLTAGAQSAAATISGSMTGILATDSVDWAYTSTPPAATSSRLIVNPVVGANSISFTRTNPTAATITPTAMVINWRVIR